jgi:REP element-mobilizing transposase RayT
LEYAGAIYHVMSRGNERRAVFRTDQDRRRFLKKLGQIAEEHHVEVYAYVLMGNHYHLLLFTPRGNLSAFMQQLNTSYTMYFNRCHSRIGHLFSGRYKAKIVEGGDYLLRLTRYIHLNPVKKLPHKNLPQAERAAYLEAYRWSSYRSYVHQVSRPKWLICIGLQGFQNLLGGKAESAYSEYVQLALDKEDPLLTVALNRSSKGIGSEAFCRQAEMRHREGVQHLPRSIDIAARRVECGIPLERITAEVLRFYGMKKQALFRRGNREAKSLWVKLANEEGGLSQRDIGVHLGYADGSGASRRLAQASAAIGRDRRLAQQYRELRAIIANCKA